MQKHYYYDFKAIPASKAQKNIVSIIYHKGMDLIMRSGKKDETTRGSARSENEPEKLTEEREVDEHNYEEEEVRSCNNCLFCVRIIKAGENLLCACTNGERELEARFYDFKWWVLCQNDARCWKSNPRKQEKKLEPEMPTPASQAIIVSLRDEIISSSSKREALLTLEKYRRDIPAQKKERPKKPSVPTKVVSERSCHNCYFCVTERTISDASWCHCSNPARSIEVSPGIPWVESRPDLPCWKAKQE